MIHVHDDKKGKCQSFEARFTDPDPKMFSQTEYKLWDEVGYGWTEEEAVSELLRLRAEYVASLLAMNTEIVKRT